MADARTRVEAEFQERTRILFTARERSSVNVRSGSRCSQRSIGR